MEPTNPPPRLFVSPSLSVVGCPLNGEIDGWDPMIQPEPLRVAFPTDDLSDFPPMEWIPAVGPPLMRKTPKLEPLDLPDLASIESPIPDPAAHLPLKRFRPSPPTPPPAIPFQRSVLRSSEIGRRRRRAIGDRTRILEGLMPWEKKMDMGSMLEEAHKYVRFLEAQVTALQAMPVGSEWFAEPPSRAGFGVGLEALNRQQLLQVMMSSAPVQDWLYKKGLCVFSAEQVAALKKAPQVLRLMGPTGDQ